jgi:hypothetical protein
LKPSSKSFADRTLSDRNHTSSTISLYVFDETLNDARACQGGFVDNPRPFRLSNLGIGGGAAKAYTISTISLTISTGRKRFEWDVLKDIRFSLDDGGWKRTIQNFRLS